MLIRLIVSLVITILIPTPSLSSEQELVAFSEIAWMGTSASSSDEWIELFNPTSSDINLTGWIIRNEESTLKIELTGTISAKSFFILERTDDTTLPNIVADQIYSGLLRNSGEKLGIFDNDGNLIDKINEWAAGDSKDRASMSRKDFNQLGFDPTYYCTSILVDEYETDTRGNPIIGTPGSANVCEKLVDEPIEEPLVTKQIIINEILTGSEAQAERDHFIELYNSSTEEIPLLDWQIRGVTTGGNWIDITTNPEKVIQPGNYFVLSHYTNSSYSALEDKPQINKSSILIPEGLIDIELKDPEGNISDHLQIERIATEDGVYRSLEKSDDIWLSSILSVGLKLKFSNTYATPGYINSHSPQVGEIENLEYVNQEDSLTMTWINPESEYFSHANIYHLNEWKDGWNLIGSSGESNYLIPNHSTEELTAYKISTTDTGGRESQGEEIWIYPDIGIIISEILPNPKHYETVNEFVELKNIGTESIDLFGWELDDESWENDISYYFEDEFRDYLLEPGAHLVLNRFETGISLSNYGDGVVLFDYEGNEVDSYYFAPIEEGQSWAINPYPPHNWIILNHPTPGKANIDINRSPIPRISTQGGTKNMTINVTGANSFDPDQDDMEYYWDFGDGFTSIKKNPPQHTYKTPGIKIINLLVTDEWGYFDDKNYVFEAAKKPSSPIIDVPPITELNHYKLGDVVFERVLPNPQGGDAGKEKIILKNKTSSGVDIVGWSLIDANDHTHIFTSLIIPSSASKQISESIFQINLNNSNEQIKLYDGHKTLIDEIKWKNAGSGQWLINPKSLSDNLEVNVLRVVDGDTCVIQWNDMSLKVRLIGVDTPETVHPFKPIEFYGKQASNFLKSQIENKIIHLKFDENKIDKYGRILAYVYLGDTLINSEIIKQGYGYAYTRFPFLMKSIFIKLEEEAREAKRGLWKEGIVSRKEYEEEVEIEEEILLIEEIPEEELIIEEITEQDSNGDQEGGPDPHGGSCLSSDLKIHSFLPNNQKGESHEYISIENIGTENTCISGWKIDDVEDGGSKSFEIKGGAIATGAKRTFRKSETKITLNNSNDCVTLVNPLNEIIDQICYTKTHKNEIFTHNGGNYVSAITSKKVKSDKSSITKKMPKPDIQFHQWSFANQIIQGVVENIDESSEIIYFKIADEQIIPISYSYGYVDLWEAQELIDFEKPIEIKVHQTDDIQELLAIAPQIIQEDEHARNLNIPILTLGVIGLIIASLVFIKL